MHDLCLTALRTSLSACLASVTGCAMQQVDAINDAFAAEEGCLVEGWLRVQRVAGNLHISVHMDDYIMLDRVSMPPSPMLCRVASCCNR